MEKKDIRWVQRFSNYQKALKQLKEAVDLMKTRDLSNLEKQEMIQLISESYFDAFDKLRIKMDSLHRDEVQKRCDMD